MYIHTHIFLSNVLPFFLFVGIPAHVDTHSAFLDPITALSLGSDVVMEFRKPSMKNHSDNEAKEDQKHVSVFLPQRSLLIMSGESRYGWTHGITPRKIDVFQTKDGRLTTMNRRTRISFTFRRFVIRNLP